MRKVSPAAVYQFLSLALLALTMFLVSRYVPVLETISELEQKLRAAGLAAPVAYPSLSQGAICY
jgi:hypothetical protein